MAVADLPTVSLREHLEAVWNERDRRVTAQMETLVSVVREGQAQSAREHAEVSTELKSLRRDVTSLQAAASTTQRIRSTDLAKVGVLVGAISAVVAFVPH